MGESRRPSELGSASQGEEGQRSREEGLIWCGHIGKRSRERGPVTSSPSSEGPRMKFSSHGGQGV